MVKISACVITKNEEDNIVKWIDNIKNVADEMIVVDTGSTDKTMEIAKNAGAKVFRITWRGDFAAAKNYALNKAKGNWIIFLDADEYFSVPSQANVRPTIETIDGNRHMIAIEAILSNIDIDHNDRVISTTTQTRIFRRNPRLKYEGRVHESLKLPPSNRPWQILDAPLEIIHTGYSESLTEKKNRRNLELLLADIKATGKETPEHYTYLSTTYLNLKEYEKAIHYANLAIETKVGGLTQAYVKQYRVILKSQRGLNQSDEELQKTVDRALADLPDHPDFLWEDSMLAMHVRDFVRLEQNLQKIFDKVADPNLYKEYETTIISDIMKVKTAWACLLNFQGKKIAATNLLLERLRVESTDEALLSSFFGVVRDLDAEQILAALKEIYNTDEDRKFVAKTLHERPRNAIYLYYAQPPENSYEYFMAKEQYVKAAQAATKLLAACFFRGLNYYRAGTDKDTWEMLLPEMWKAEDVSPKATDLPSGLLIKNSLLYMRQDALALMCINSKEILDCQKELEILPKEMQRVIERFYGNGKLTAEDFDAYRTLLREVCIYAPREVINNYAALATEFDERDMLTAANDIFEKEHFHALLPIFVSMPDNSPLMDGSFWYKLGRCLLNDGDFEAAGDAFQKAIDAGATEDDARGFNEWCKAKNTGVLPM